MSRRILFKFRLYVAGDAHNGALAKANLNALCRVYLAGQHKIEVVDVLKEPKRAMWDSIFMTPTLVKLSPPLVQRIVGTLSHTEVVLQALGLGAVPV